MVGPSATPPVEPAFSAGGTVVPVFVMGPVVCGGTNIGGVSTTGAAAGLLLILEFDADGCRGGQPAEDGDGTGTPQGFGKELFVGTIFIFQKCL